MPVFNHRKSDFTGLGQLQDCGKTEIQLLCQHYTLSATCRSIEDLETEIVELEVINTSTGERGCIEDLKSKKNGQGVVRVHRSGHAFRTSQTWMIPIAGLEKKHRQNNAETNSLDRQLQLDELHSVLQSMQGRRAQVVDGLTIEFYRVFYDVVAHDMLDVFNEILVLRSLPLSCRRAVVILLPKKGKKTSKFGTLCPSCVWITRIKGLDFCLSLWPAG